MFHHKEHQGSSVFLRRSRREITLSEKAEAAIKAGTELPGMSHHAGPSSDGEQKQKSTSQAKTTSIGRNTNREKATARQMAGSKRARSASGEVPYASISSSSFDRFGHDQVVIYFWEDPVPKDFPNLSNSHREWKEAVDKNEERLDINDGADDWDAFDNALEDRAIASCFVNRAKRAFWAGKTWSEFEHEERSIDTQASRGNIHADAYALDNKRRMVVFEGLRVRLCEEIWLEPYPDAETESDSKAPAPTEGIVRRVFPPARRLVPPPSAWRQRFEPTEEERVRGLVAWTRTRGGPMEPWYEGEEVNPAGIDNLRRYYEEMERLKVQRRTRVRGKVT